MFVKTKAKAVIIAGIIVAFLVVAALSWLGVNSPEVLKRMEVLIQSHGYAGVFVSTVIAGSIIPFGSPIIVALAAGFGLDVASLGLTAATGYTLGVLTSYVPAWLFGEHYVKKKMGEGEFKKYVESWNKHGYKLCVLFSLIPGFPVDLLALVCGCLHTKAELFIPICWFTLMIQFLLCGWIRQFLGERILPMTFLP